MIYITGDTHCDFGRFEAFCARQKTTADDIMIILGDAGLNYFAGCLDDRTKQRAAAFPLTFFCIHGNHEQRPSEIPTYRTRQFCGGEVWYEEEYPNLLFARDGEIYDLGGYRCIVIGGAYSVDRMFRIAYGHPWYPNEQPSEEIRAYVGEQLRRTGHRVDVVLSHTCPRRFEPTEVFLPGIDQSRVDKSTEDWLDTIEQALDYDAWYCGHYHTEKQDGRLKFMYRSIEPFMPTGEDR